jgi:hypothetical protein
MAIYGIKVDGITTGSTANTYKTLLALKMANTAGHVARLRKVIIAGGGGAAQDVQVDVKIDRTDISTDGTSTSVNVNTIQSHDPLQRTSAVDAIGKNFSAEPTAFAGTPIGAALNSRGTLALEWPSGCGPLWGKAQALAILGAPGVATATTLSIAVEWEE